QLVVLRWVYAAAFSLLGIGVLWLLGFPHALLKPALYLFVTIIPRAVSEAIQGVLRGISEYGAFFAVDLTVGLTLVAGGGALLAWGGTLSLSLGAELASALAGCIVALVLARRYRTAAVRWVKWSQVL